MTAPAPPVGELSAEQAKMVKRTALAIDAWTADDILSLVTGELRRFALAIAASERRQAAKVAREEADCPLCRTFGLPYYAPPDPSIPGSNRLWIHRHPGTECPITVCSSGGNHDAAQALESQR